MARAVQWLQWLFFIGYAVGGAVALMLATPPGLRLLGLSVDTLTFVPATILGLPWSALTLVFDDGPITLLAVLGISYGLNFGVVLMLAREDRR
jgi:hypothetical protein